MPYGSYHSHNGVSNCVGLVSVLGKLLADRILAWETAIRQFLVYDNDRRLAGSVLDIESATSNQLNLERSKIIGRDRRIFGGWLLSEPGFGLADNTKVRRRVITVKWRIGSQCRRFRAWDRLHSLEERPIKRGHFRRPYCLIGVTLILGAR